MSTKSTPQRAICTMNIIVLPNSKLAEIADFQKGYNQINPKKEKPVPFTTDTIDALVEGNKHKGKNYILVPYDTFSEAVKIFIYAQGLYEQVGTSIELGDMTWNSLSKLDFLNKSHSWTIQTDKDTVLTTMPVNDMEFFLSLRRVNNTKQRKFKGIKTTEVQVVVSPAEQG